MIKQPTKLTSGAPRAKARGTYDFPPVGRNPARRPFIHGLKSVAFWVQGKNGQHALEYIILVTLIMAGIIIGGPYVIRSWNAQMKGWEDSVRDSMTDPLTNEN